MGSPLRTEVERQLLADLDPYGIKGNGLSIDWSEACQEGHLTTALDGELEELSGLTIRDQAGTAVADGWMDFVHGGDTNPLFVFWLFLAVGAGAERRKVKADAWIPDHVWERLPDSTKSLCAQERGYDGRWVDDPKVAAWRRSQAS
jgi:hypothetical protein